MIRGNRQHVVVDPVSNFKMGKVLCFGEPLVQMITPHVALNGLINCLPSGNYLTIQRFNCRFQKLIN